MRWTVFWTAASLCAAAQALAQAAPPEAVIARPLTGTVNDHFDTASKTSGGVLAGLRVAVQGNVPFDPANVLVAAPAAAAGIICVRGVSRDGLYWTRTPYAIDAAEPARGAVRLQPFASPDIQPHLRRYARGEVALVAFTAADENCFEDQGLFLPEMPPEGGGRELQMLINSGSRQVSARLDAGAAGQGAGQLPGTCAAVQHERIAFDTLCRLPLGGVAGPLIATLHIELDDGLFPSTKTYRVQLR